MKHGWITPRGQTLECSFYAHLEALCACAEAQTMPELQDFAQQAAEMRADCTKLAEDEGHGEWHRYEMLMDRISGQLWLAAMNAGFVRVGTIDNTLHFEGLPQALQQHHARCVALAEEQGVPTRFEPFKGGEYRPW